MRISKVNTIVNNQGKQKTLNNNRHKNQNFNGVIDKFSLGVANAIENGGLAVSFTLQDMLGTNIPRPLVGLLRNSKENKGEKNYKFAAKELVREFTTGPSMFAIPIAMLGAADRLFGSKTANIPMEQIKAFGEVHAAAPLKNGQKITKKDFCLNAFTEMIKNAKNETVISSDTLETANNFNERLFNHLEESKSYLKDFLETKSIKQTKAIRKGRKEQFDKISEDFFNIVKKHAQESVNTDFTKARVKNSTMSFNDTINNMLGYADDVVEKVNSGKVLKDINSSAKLSSGIKKLVNGKTVARFGMNVAMITAVISFLRIVPKLYNKAEGQENAGLKGLMKEETLNDKALNTTEKKDKSNPSFGCSAASVSGKIANKLTGSGIIGKIARGMEFEGPNVSFPLLLSIMGFGILLPRTKQAKDKYDREEILRRDVTTSAIMCFGEKALRKCFSKRSEAKSGLVVANKPANFDSQSTLKKLFDYIRPIKGVNTLTTPQIISKYSNIDSYKDGITGFCDFIDGQKGNLSKVFSLTEESKNLVQNVLGENVNIANADNKTIRNALNNAKDTENVKKLVDLFKDKNNPWVTKVKTINARFTTFSVILFVPLVLGALLPLINERATKKRIRKEQALAGEKKQMPDMNLLLQNTKNSKIFADMTKYLN